MANQEHLDLLKQGVEVHRALAEFSSRGALKRFPHEYGAGGR